MNKKFYSVLLGGLALVMASCSNDEPFKGETPEAVNGEKYMAFTISNLAGGRAIADDPASYENAAGNEGAVTAENVYFLFYDAKGVAFTMENRSALNGTVVYTNMVKPTEIKKTDNALGSESIEGTLVLGKAEDPFIGTTPAQVLVIANPNTDAMKNLSNVSLSEALNVTTSYSGGWSGTSTFLMTNASYASGGKQVTAVDVTDNIKNTADDAKKSPAIINLERAVAKVRVKYTNNYDVINTSAPAGATDAQKKQFEIVDGKGTDGVSTVNLKAQVYGWRLMNWTNMCYGFKKLSVSDYAGFEWTWNDETNRRSYWAYSGASAAGEFNNPTYDLYDSNQFLNKAFTSGTDNVVYCYEHTRNSKATTKTTRPTKDYVPNEWATAICVKVTIGTETDGVFTPLNFVKWAGKLYTVEKFNSTVIETYMSANPTADRTKLSVKFVDDNANKNTYKAVVSNTANNTDTTMETYNNILWWKEGVTSYWINIEHFGDLFGVVRNHIYDYTVEAVNGLGIPGNNPEVPVEEKTFLAAALNILKWRVVNHNVTLE